MNDGKVHAETAYQRQLKGRKHVSVGAARAAALNKVSNHSHNGTDKSEELLRLEGDRIDSLFGFDRLTEVCRDFVSISPWRKN